MYIPKTVVFVDVFTYCNLRKPTVFFNPSTPYQISLIVVSVDNSGVAEGGGGELPLIIIVNNWINKRTSEKNTQFSALVSDCSFI